MKLNFKMIAVAAAMVATSAAHADLVTPGTGNSSLALVAFNTVTNAFYVRDLGYLLNQFLPSSITTTPGDATGGTATTGTPITGDKTPEAGLLLNKSTNTSFADAAFGTWLAGQTGGAANVRWTLSAGDTAGTSVTLNVKRLLLASSTPLTVSNGTLDNAVNLANGIGALVGQTGPFTLSSTGLPGSSVPASYLQNLILQPNTLSTLDQASGLYYFTRSTGTGSTATAAKETQFGNSVNMATVTLASNGDFTYALAPAAVSAVPVPAAAWLMGSGLMALGGMFRRRKAAQAAA